MYSFSWQCLHTICSDVECKEDSVRLSGGTGSNEGRVEVCLSGQWGMVCVNGWNNTDATVVCRQLGFSDDGEKGGMGGRKGGIKGEE